MRFSWIGRFLVAGMLVVAGTAGASDEAALARARTYSEAALQAYGAGEFDSAAKAFEEALALVPPDHPNAPALMFSAAQAYRRQYAVDENPRNLVRARELYGRYLDVAKDGSRVRDAQVFLLDVQAMLARTRSSGEPEKAPVERTQLLVSSQTAGALVRIDAGARGAVGMAADVTPGEHTVEVEAPGFISARSRVQAQQGRLVVAAVELQALPALVTIAAPEDARIFVDGVHLGRAPLDGPARLPAGEHLLTVTANGHFAATRRLDLERGQTLSTAIPKLPITNQRLSSFMVLGGAGAATVAGLVTGLLAYGEQSDALSVDPNKHAGQLSVDPYNQALADRNSLKTPTFILLGSAAVLAVTGLMLYGLDAPEVPAPPITVHGLASATPVDTGAR